MSDTTSIDAAAAQILALLTQLELSNARVVVAQDSGQADAYIFTPTPAIAGYGSDLLLFVDILNPNLTTAPKLTASGLGQVAITAANGLPVAIGAVAGKCLFGFSSVSGGGYVAKLLGTLTLGDGLGYSAGAVALNILGLSEKDAVATGDWFAFYSVADGRHRKVPAQAWANSVLSQASQAVSTTIVNEVTTLTAASTIFVSSAGNDANPGTQASPVATINQAVALMSPFFNGSIVMLTDIHLTSRLNNSFSGGIFGAAGAVRNLFIDQSSYTQGPNDLSGNPGEWGSILLGNNGLSFTNIAIQNNVKAVTGASNAGAIVFNDNGSCTLFDGSYSAVAGCIPLLYFGGACSLTASSFTLGTNGPGNLINGIAAGGNPNSSWNCRSNLTSA